MPARTSSWVPRLLVCCSYLLIGCGDELAQPSRLVSELVTDSEAELHELADFPLPVCFRPEGDGTATQRANVRSWVEAAWLGLPRSAIAFSRWDTCTDDDAGPGTIKINLDSSFVRGLTSNDWNVQLPTVGSTSWRTYTAIHEFGHVLGIHHEQIHPDKPASCTDGQAGESLAASDLVLTEYDQDAAMNYCAPNPVVLSDREKLFAEMAYPSNTANHLIRASGGFRTVDGLLVPTAAVLRTEWTARGARPEAFSEVRWLAAGIWWVTNTLQLGSSGGPVSIDYEFEDFRGVFHSGAGESVTVHGGKFSAIANAIVN